MFEALQAVDGALHCGIEALDAQACAVDAAVAERFRHRFGERAWIDLDGNLCIGQHKERIAQGANQVDERFGCHDRRCPAAEVDVGDRKPLSDRPGDKMRLLTQTSERRLRSGRRASSRTCGSRSTSTWIGKKERADRSMPAASQGPI